MVSPVLRGVLRALGGFMPKRSLQATAQQLVYAGEPGGMTVLDFMGIRLLFALLLGGGYLYLNKDVASVTGNLSYSLILALIGSVLPSLWFRRRVRARQNEILDSLPDTLDMLTIGVEAGLAFESALLRVGEHWETALSKEFRRVVTDMRLGGGRNEALQRMVARTGVEELASLWLS